MGAVKPCASCGAELPLSEFYHHPQMTDRLFAKCKPCVRAAQCAKRRRERDALAVLATPSRRCRGECRRVLALTEFALKGRGDERRSVCRSCDVCAVQGRRRTDRERGVKRCDECGHKLPFERFARIPNTRKFADTCTGCATYLAGLRDPIEEADAIQRHGMRQSQRWAIAFDDVLTARGLTMATYRALRGAARAAFEAAWSERMRDLATMLADAEARAA